MPTKQLTRIAKNLPFDARRERVAVVYLNAKGRVQATEWVAKGSGGTATFDIPRVLDRAKTHKATRIALIHNHPSGALHGSKQDQVVTQQVKRAASARGLTLVDHVVVANGQTASVAKGRGKSKVCVFCSATVRDVPSESTRDKLSKVMTKANTDDTKGLSKAQKMRRARVAVGKVDSGHTTSQLGAVMVLAGKYRKEGKSASVAMKMAWAEVRAGDKGVGAPTAAKTATTAKTAKRRAKETGPAPKPTASQPGFGPGTKGKLPANAIIQFPSKKWGFVGKVDSRLSFEYVDGGGPLSAEDLRKVQQHGPGLFRKTIKTRSWNTRDEAIAAAEALGLEVTKARKPTASSGGRVAPAPTSGSKQTSEPKPPGLTPGRRTGSKTMPMVTGSMGGEVGPDTPPNVKPEDVSFTVLERSYTGISWMPNERARTDQRDYVQVMRNVWTAFTERATNGEELDRAGKLFEEFRQQSVAKTLELAHKRSGLMSAGVVGPAKFPFRAQEKKQVSYGKALTTFVAWQERAVNVALEKIHATKTTPTADDVQKQIEDAKRLHETMKAANRIIRQKGGGDGIKEDRLVEELGLSRATAKKIMAGDILSRKGFPDYELRSILGKIKRLEARATERAAPEVAPVEVAGVRVEEDKESDRLRLYFPDKPEADVRTQLKRNGFKWAPSVGAWQRQLNNTARAAAEQVLKGLDVPPARIKARTPSITKRKTPPKEPDRREMPGSASLVNGDITEATGTDPSRIYQFRWAVVALDDLRASHTTEFDPAKNYPAEIQPRIRDRATSRLQVTTMAQNLNASALLQDTHTLDRGAPIVGPDMVVESGNGRVIALKIAKRDFPARYNEYWSELLRWAREYGINSLPTHSSGSALVRVRLTDIDRVKFAAEANASAVLQMSPMEQAIQDSGRLTDEEIARLQTPDTMTVDRALMSPSNAHIVNGFLGTMGANERAALVDSHGTLNQTGLQRLKAAIFAKVYPGDAGQRLISAFVEVLDPMIKNVEGAMFDSLPQMARAEGLVRSGQRAADLSITDDIARAVDKMASLKGQRIQISDYLQQQSFMDRELTPAQEQILIHLDQFGRSRKVLREFLQGYAAAVEAAPHPDQGGLFGDMVQEAKPDIVKRLVDSQSAKGSSGALWDLVEARERAGFGTVNDPGTHWTQVGRMPEFAGSR